MSRAARETKTDPLYPENVHVVGYAFLLFAFKTVPPTFEFVCIEHLYH
jgi:hypothetical protein